MILILSKSVSAHYLNPVEIKSDEAPLNSSFYILLI